MNIVTQATAWLRQLNESTVESLADVGRTADETENLQQEHEKMEVTSKVRILIKAVVILVDISIYDDRCPSSVVFGCFRQFRP